MNNVAQKPATASPIRVTVIHDTKTLGMLAGQPVEDCTLAATLTREWPRDTHFTAYEPRTGVADDGTPCVLRLLHEPKEGRPAVYECFDDLDVPNVRMVALIGDIDDPVAHKTETPARPEWRAEQLPKLEASGLAYYQTRGGYRTLATTDFVIETRDDAERWKAQYEAWCGSVEAEHGLVLDRTCKDWTRLYRAPNVLRAGKKQRAPVVGEMPAIDLHGAEPKAPSGARPKAQAPKRKAGAAKGDRRFGGVEMDRNCPEGVDPVDHALNLAEGMLPAVQGDGGHLTLFRLACDLVRGLGIEPDAAKEMLWLFFNPRCEPPWKDHERKDFDRKVSEADKHCTQEAGYLLPKVKVPPANQNGTPGPGPHGPAANNPPSPPLFLITEDGKETWHYDPRTGAYTPFGFRALVTSLNETGAANMIPMKKHGPQELINNGPTAKVLAVATDLGRACRADWEPTESRVLLGVRCRAVEPKHDADVDAWLRALASDQYDTVCTFIASCAQEFIGRPAITLAILGPDSIGKTLTAMALASMWNASHPVPLRAVMEKFNASMARCPIVLDDECDALKADMVSTESFRKIVQDDSRDIEPKGQEKRTLLGCQRFVITGNDETDIHFSDAKPGAIKAIGVRMAIVAVPHDRRDEIITLLDRVLVPGSSRVDMDRLRGHFAWIQDEWRAKIGQQRFIGSSEANAEAAIAAMMAGRVERFPEFFQILADVLLGEERAKGDCFVHGGRLLVRAELFAESISAPGIASGSLREIFSAAAVRTVFSHASTGRQVVKIAGKAVTCMGINADLITRALGLDAVKVAHTLSLRGEAERRASALHKEAAEQAAAEARAEKAAAEAQKRAQTKEAYTKAKRAAERAAK